MRPESSVDHWASVTPADLLRSVIGHLPSVVFVSLLVTAISCGLLLALPNKYGSDGLMYVRLGRGAVSVDPTAHNPGSGVSIQETRSAEVMSVAEMIASREIAERAVSDIGVEEITKPRSWIDRFAQVAANLIESSKSSGSMWGPEYDVQIKREEAIARVRNWLRVEVPKNGYTVAISANGPDPFLVQAITQSVMNHYKNFHVEAHRSDGSLEFFENQVEESRQSAVQSREALQIARSNAGWTSIESAEDTLRQRLVALEIALDETLSNLADSQQRRDSLKKQLVATQEWIPTEITKGVANVASDSMKTQLFGEQVEESEQLATLKPEHPRFRLLQEKMTRSQDIVADEAIERELTREALNPLWQQLESEFSLASAKAEGLQSKSESLRESLQNGREELLRLNKDAVAITRLKWEADIAEETLLDHARKLEEARVIYELDRKNMSDVSVVQDASLNLKKVGPPRALLAVIGAFLGIALGTFQAILRHPLAPQASDTAPAVEDNQFDSDPPVEGLVTEPEIRQHDDVASIAATSSPRAALPR